MIITKTEVWHVNHFIHDEGKKEKNMIYSKMISYSHKDNIKFRNYMWKIIYENTKKNLVLYGLYLIFSTVIKIIMHTWFCSKQ